VEDRASADEQLPFVSFDMGKAGMTTGFSNLFDSPGEAAAAGVELLQMHSSGDFGALEDCDRQANLVALHSSPPGRLLSRYLIGEKKTPVYVITEHDRSSTLVLLSSEY